VSGRSSGDWSSSVPGDWSARGGSDAGSTTLTPDTSSHAS
jgi:hypothetical protein